MMKLIRSIFGDIRTYNSQLNFRWTSNSDLAGFFRAEYKGNAAEAYDYFICTGKSNFSG